MYPINLWLLKRFCDRYGLDYQEIDDTLSYYENKEHLQSLVWGERIRAFGPIETDRSGLRTWEHKEAEWESQMAQYVAEHLLEEYIAYRDAGWTISTEVGEPNPYPTHYPPFSLEQFIIQRNVM